MSSPQKIPWWGYVLAGFFAIGLVVGLASLAESSSKSPNIYVAYAPSRPAPTEARSKAQSVSLVMMLTDYGSDASKANTEYKGRYIEVTGLVKMPLTYTGFDGQPVRAEYFLIGAGDETSPIIQCFPGPNAQGLEGVGVGQSVTIVGLVGTSHPAHKVFRLPTIVMRECVLK